MIARGAQARPGRVPPPEPAARGPPARHRPAHRGCAARDGARQGPGADELVAAVRPRQRHGPARPRPRDRHQGGDRRRPRRSPSSTSSADGSVTLSCGTVDMGQGSDTGHGADRRRSAQHSGRKSIRVIPRDTDVTPYDMGTLGSRSTVPHGARGAARGRRGARQDRRRWPRDVGEPEGSNIPIAELFQKRYGMQAGNVIGTGELQARLCVAEPGAMAKARRSRRSG